MALNQAETFEWLRNRVQELEAEIKSLRANHAAEVEKARQDEREWWQLQAKLGRTADINENK